MCKMLKMYAGLDNVREKVYNILVNKAELPRSHRQAKLKRSI